MDEINKIVLNVIDEVKNTGVSSNDGLCFYFANNILFDLHKSNIMAEMMNIRDYTFADYDHYFVLASVENRYFLIDPTYSQFVSDENKVFRDDLCFNVWPSEILKQIGGKDMLNSLLNKGITEVLENDMIMYLKSFNNNEDLYFSFDGIFNYGRQL